MKKVLQLITRLDKGGSAELVLQTCKKLAEQNYDVILVTGQTADPPFNIIDYAKSNNFKLLVIKHLIRDINPIQDILAYFEIKKILKNEKPDILHTNTSKAGFIGRLAGHSAGIPKIFHSPHGHIFYGYYSTFVTGVFIFMEKLAARYSTKIFNLTEKGRQDHINKKIGPADKFVVSSCGVDLSEFSTGEPKSLSKEKIKILWVGRFVPIKNPYLVLKIAKYFQDQHIEFRMVGDGELLEDIRQKIIEENINNIILTGYKNQLKEEFVNADIFIITSKNEGFGRVIVEAMAVGLPVIATEVGGIPELIKNNQNGFLINSEDIHDIINKINYLLDNKEKYSQISLNNLRSSMIYSLDNYIENITRYY